MVWPVIEKRFSSWFAEATARGDHALANRLIGIVVKLRTAGGRFDDSLRFVLDELEIAEAEPCRRTVEETGQIGALHALVADFEDLLRDVEERDSGAGSCWEAGVPYLTEELSPTAERTR